MRSVASAVLFILLASGPVGAQVIEIDIDGNAQTFDGPTLFEDGAAEPIADAEPGARRLSPRDVLRQAARDQGLNPSLLEAVAWQESRGRMDAVSPKGAVGIMQLMPGTAAELGVRADDLAENVRGGALYLRRQLDRFGNVELALAAYNAGPGAVMRYRGIPPYRETRDYVARIMSRWALSAPRADPDPGASAGPADALPNSLLIEVPSL